MEALDTPIISVRFFNNERIYDYLNNDKFNIFIGDFVIVPTRDTFNVGQVVCGKTNFNQEIGYKKVSYKIDLEKFKNNFTED